MADVLPRFADGAWICDLATASDAEELDQIVATTLGVSPRAGVANREAVAEFLQAKDQLLVLDNCEHLLAAVGALAAPAVTERTSHTLVTATSNAPSKIAAHSTAT